MTPIMLYTITLCTMLLLCVVQKKGILGTILVLSYGIIAVFALFVADKEVLLYSKIINSSYLNYGTVLFLLVSCFLFFSPFLTDRSIFNSSKMEFAINGNFILFAKIYIVMLIVSIFIYLPRVLSVFQSGAWAANLASFVSGDTTWAYGNIIEKLIVNFTGYFTVFGLILAFSLLQHSRNKKTGVHLLILLIIHEVFRDTYLSARGILVEFVLLLLALYLFFYPDIDKRTKRVIIIVSISIAVIVISYLIAVTISRFSSAAQNSVIYYLGQPPFIFGLETQEINSPMLGRFAFGVLFGDDKFPLEMSNWVHGFYMFFGWLYADWSFIGVIIIGFFWKFYLGKLIRKRSLALPEIYIIFTCYNLLLQGTFTIGRSKCYEIISYFFIYWLLIILTKVSFNYGGRKLTRLKI